MKNMINSSSLKLHFKYFAVHRNILKLDLNKIVEEFSIVKDGNTNILQKNSFKKWFFKIK